MVRWARLRQSGTSPDTWYGMPQIEKFGYSSATITDTSAPGSSSRARSAALIPASLPPIATSRMASYAPKVCATCWLSSETPAGDAQQTAPAPDAVAPVHSSVAIVSSP